MAKNIIGIDIGGTKIAGVVFNGNKVIKELTISTPKTLFEFERNLLKLVNFLSAGEKIYGIGIGCAGKINPKTGDARISSNLKFKAIVNFNKIFKKLGKVKIKADNDSNCFTRQELVLGLGQKYKNFLGLILGTGMGGGIVIDKKLYRGADSSGAEFGHLVWDKGFVEDAYYKTAKTEVGLSKMSVILGKYFAGLINIFAPEALILGGGFAQANYKKFLPKAKKEMKKHLFNPDLDTKILVSQTKNAGAIGAALLFK